MATTRTITATAPDGTQVSTNVGAKRAVGAIRIMDTRAWGAEHVARFGPWLVTVHRTLDLAVRGSNQTTAWNGYTRWAIEIDANDKPAGQWFGANLGG